MGLFNEQAQLVAKEKLQRKSEKSTELLSSCLWGVDDLSDSSKLFTTGRHSGQSAWLNVHALSAVGTLLRKNASCSLIFKISNHKEYDLLREEYAYLVGKETFDSIYQRAVGKGAPQYSFLTIQPHEQDDNKFFMARFDTRLIVENEDELT